MIAINLKDWVFKSQRQRVSPFPNYFSMETVCNDMKKAVGFNADEILYFIQKNIHYLFMTKVGYERVGRGVADRIHQNPKLAEKLVNAQHKYGEILADFTKRANKTVGQKTTNKNLYKFFSDYEKKYKEVYCRYGWVWIFEDFYIVDLLKIVESKVEDRKRAAEILNLLTSEPTAMVATVERKALLKLGVKVESNAVWRQLVLENKEDEIKKDKKLKALIDRHVKDYFWVTRDYEDPALDFSAVISRLAGYLKKDIQGEYRELLGSIVENEKRRERYLKELAFSQSELASINSMRRVAYLKELRKRYVSESLYYFDKVLLEIGRRLYLSLNQTRHLRTEEVKAGLLNGKDFSEILNERIKLSLWHCREGVRSVILDKETTEKLFKLFCAVDKEATEFTGMPVSPGVARGPARLIMNPDECDKVQTGDVIVSIQVVPSFSTAIMRAAALVCDGGHGITTHPATLAREAGIPGVIQTRFAMKALKDGDMIEVDGYRGVVKKLST